MKEGKAERFSLLEVSLSGGTSQTPDAPDKSLAFGDADRIEPRRRVHERRAYHRCDDRQIHRRTAGKTVRQLDERSSHPIKDLDLGSSLSGANRPSVIAWLVVELAIKPRP